MKSESGKAVEDAEKRFDAEWIPKLFPHWYGVSVWRWLSRPFRIKQSEYAKDYYRLGFVEGYEQRKHEEKADKD